MKKILKFVMSIAVLFAIGFSLVACGNDVQMNQGNQNQANRVAEKMELANATLGEIEFENADTVRIAQDGNQVAVTGTVNAMSAAQKNAFGDENVTHVVSLKYTFDKEKTISSFELKGNVTKVFSTNENDENYVGRLSDLLDSAEGEDAFCYLILSAATKQYTLTAKYTDETTSAITLKMNATLATATAE